MHAEFEGFDDFYRYYLTAHRHPWNRRLHLLGWMIGGTLSVCSFPSAGPFALPLGVAAGLSLALAGHRVVEKNESLVFRYPLWSARADLRMFGAMARDAFVARERTFRCLRKVH